jgi:hypothetical protein
MGALLPQCAFCREDEWAHVHDTHAAEASTQTPSSLAPGAPAAPPDAPGLPSICLHPPVLQLLLDVVQLRTQLCQSSRNTCTTAPVGQVQGQQGVCDTPKATVGLKRHGSGYNMPHLIWPGSPGVGPLCPLAGPPLFCCWVCQDAIAAGCVLQVMTMDEDC